MVNGIFLLKCLSQHNKVHRSSVHLDFIYVYVHVTKWQAIFKYLFICLIEKEGMCVGEGGREGERNSQKDSPLNAGLVLTTLRS